MERWREQRAAQAATEGLTLVRSSKSNTGFKGVCYKPAYGGRKPYALRVWEGHKYTCLGCFATAEEAALEYARRLGPRAAVAQPLTAEAAEAQAAAKGLTLVRSSESNTGFKGVYCDNRQVHKMFMVQVREGGKQKHLGHFITVEEAALVYARHLGARGSAVEAAAARPPAALTVEMAVARASQEGLTLVPSSTSSAGFKGVCKRSSRYTRKPFALSVKAGGKQKHLGYFATAEEAALESAATSHYCRRG